jgi:hypothetical protein
MLVKKAFAFPECRNCLHVGLELALLHLIADIWEVKLCASSFLVHSFFSLTNLHGSHPDAKPLVGVSFPVTSRHTRNP